LKIDKVRITGFKSFADPTEFVIGPGMTAIVGPNGCGKSNLVEGFRWAMGEMSYKNMRAEGMDDVIFGGTDTRPAKSSCEVAIFLDNSGRTAPPAFNDDGVIEAVRRLDRGDGSTYRVNGKKARARDVQVLFQDAGAGSGSVALVSQGKVGTIINSKPSDRRSILEQAAGVAGLSTRRREAETRLRATEQNLERAEDLEKGLSEQLSSLRRQARQAARKRSIDDLVKAAEATAFLVRWQGAQGRADQTAKAHAANEERVAEAILAVRAAEAEVARVEEEVAPALRDRQEAETGHALARARLETAEKEVASVRNALAAARRLVERAAADVERERAAGLALAEEIEDLVDRKAMAEEDREHDGPAVEEAAARALELEDEVTRLIAEVEELASRAAAAEAERKAADARRNEAARRVASIEARLAEARHRLESDGRRLDEIGPPSDDITGAEAALAESEAAVEAIVAARAAAASEEDEARLAHSEAQSALAALRAEIRGLKAAAPAADGVSVSVSVSDGMEVALAAALGEGIAATLGRGETRWWERSSARIAPPAGSRPLSDYVTVPPELVAALSGIGVVDEEHVGEELASGLQAGQSLVSASGRLWRWDGYRSSDVGNAAEEVRRAARLRLLSEEEPRLAREEEAAAARKEAAHKAGDDVRRQEARLADAAKAARAHLEETRRRREREDRERNEVNARIMASQALLDASAGELEQAREFLAECVGSLERLPSLREIADRLAAGRKSLEDCRSRHVAARNELDRVRRDAELRNSMIETVTRSLEDARRRKAAAEGLCAEMAGRVAEARREEERLSELHELAPRAVESARSDVDEAAERLVEAARRSSESERMLAACRQAVTKANDALTDRREERARLLAELKAAQEASEELLREIGERMSCQPGDLARIAGIEDASAALPDLAACEARVARLARERDSLGMVNPLAEEQAREMEGKLGDALKAREELREAVARLRRTITEFDQEARVRLTEAFALMDGHFRDLYTRLYGGGHAHLKLAGSDNILEAGLEVFACPPGKRLQTMSLLSGGEQALAALALVFAAFLVRPAPVCVLDEVDAPLDDANVNRLCSLVSEMARGDATRFLVVTHHALTMARADRLYGVTMAERGVSRLTSLDMEAAAAFVGSR